MPTVSVVIPAYNAGAFLQDALDSVAGQTFSDFEIIVVDDGSHDDTAAIAERHPSKPSVVSDGNGGNAVARNRGIAAAAGEWVAFLDADDLWHQEHLARALAVATQASANVVAMHKESFLIEASDHGDRGHYAERVCSRSEILAALKSPLDLSGDELTIVGPRQIAIAGVIPTTSAVMARRSLLLAAGGFPSIFSAPADIACWFQLSRLTPITVSTRRTVFYRVHGQSISNGSDKEVRAMAAYVAMWFGNTLTPYRDPDDAHGLSDHGATNAVHKLLYLLSEAAHEGERWRLGTARAFEQLLVRDKRTKRMLRRVRARRRLELAAPRSASFLRRRMRSLRR